MVDSGVEILVVEDNLDDEKLARNAFLRPKIANDVQVVRDGAVALDFAYCTGA